MALPVVIGAAAIIGVIAYARGKSDPAKPYQFGWEPGSVHPPGPGESTTATDGNGGTSQVSNDGLGVVVTPTTSSPGAGAPPSSEPTVAPNATIGAELGGSSAPSEGGCVPNAGGGYDCPSPPTLLTAPPAATSSKAMFSAQVGQVENLSPTSADRLLSDAGAKSGMIW